MRLKTFDDYWMYESLVKRIEHDFTYHAPNEKQQPIFAAIREKAKDLALYIAEETPLCREQSLALTNLEQAVMFANAAIARNTEFYV